MEPDLEQLEQTPPFDGVVLTLLCAGISTFVFFLVYVGSELIPFQPQYPLWLLKAVGALVNSFTIPLVGVLLLHLAAALGPLTNLGQLCRLWASRVSAIMLLVFLLLMPLLGLVTWRGYSNVQAANNQRVTKINRNAGALRAAISKASTTKELQMFMEEQQGPPVIPEEYNIPLPQLKAKKLALVNQIQANYISQLSGIKSNNYQPIFFQILRSAALGMAGAVSFAALVWNPNSQQSLLTIILSFITRAKARTKNVLSSLWPQPNDQKINKLLLEKSREAQRKALLRNQREMNKNELQRKKRFEKLEQAREKQRKNELNDNKNDPEI